MNDCFFDVISVSCPCFSKLFLDEVLQKRKIVSVEKRNKIFPEYNTQLAKNSLARFAFADALQML